MIEGGLSEGGVSVGVLSEGGLSEGVLSEGCILSPTVGMSIAIYSFASLQFTIAPVLSSNRARHILPLPKRGRVG